MKLVELFEEYGEDAPDGLEPYKSKNQSGRLTLSPYTNDWDPDPGFKDVDNILTTVDKKLANKDYSVAEVPVNKVLATQHWLDSEGGGDPVIPELDDLPVMALLSDGYYHILDGHHRTDKAARHGKKTIKAYVFKV